MVNTTSSITRWWTRGDYRGQQVLLLSETFSGCQHPVIEPVHHFDARGRHYCPTGFIECAQCGASGDEPDPPACTRWEEPWWSEALRVIQNWGLAGLLRRHR